MPDLLKKYLRPTGILSCLCLLGDSMLYIVLPLHWQSTGLQSFAQVGILLSINRFIRVLLHPVLMSVFKHFSLSAIFKFAGVLAAIHTFIFAMTGNFFILLIARVLWGIAWTLIRQGSQLQVIELTVSSNDFRAYAGNATGYYLGISRIGSFAGIGAAALLTLFISLQTIAAIFGIALALYLVWILQPGNFVITDETDHLSRVSLEKTRASTGQPFSVSDVLILLILGFIVSFAMHGILRSSTPLLMSYHLREIHLATTVSAIFLALRWGWDPFILSKIGRFFDRSRKSPAQKILPTQFVTKPDKQGFFLSIHPAVWVAIFGAVSFSMCTENFIPYIWIFFLLITLLSDSVLSVFIDAEAAFAGQIIERRKLTAVYSTACDLGAALGPFITYLLYPTIGIHGIILMGGGVILLSSVFIYLKTQYSAGQ
ncbi:MAG: hypothetical protein KDK41_02150 [Leptospiraceae bacterium]|nr:hypothetical protein [Leptospiraceae bacterium]